jgi:hypothetical protein
MTFQTYERSPAEIESSIEQTRASLDRKLQELEHRLSPREQFQRLRSRLDPDPLMGWMAVGAVALGAALAVNGWRQVLRARNGHGAATLDEYDIDDVMLDSAAAPQPEP